MEQFPPRQARRAASHGALHGAPSRPPQFHSFRPQPLKSVSERAGFLAPPGPLQSMLKTTTETGDIGIFSIGTVGSSSAFQHRPRARTGISEGNRPKRYMPRGGPRPAMYDDRRRLPSFNRDSTSEILSLYGSDASRSGCSSFTRRYDDSGPRSYSLTSYTSRQLQNIRTNTMTSSCSSSGFQRPRSPYPYPTRLKRPGVRPSSPAVTENGRVDYSRMVGIDHISHRTVHGSYRPVYPSQSYQQPSLSTRINGNSSNRFESHYSSYPSRRPPEQRGRPYYSSQGGPGYAEESDYLSLDNAPRTASLSSLSNNYRHPGLTPHRHLPRPQPPRLLYYDGSEEFEDTTAQIPVPLSPIAPIPTRAVGSHRPMVLGEDCEEQLQAGPTADYSAYQRSQYSEVEAPVEAPVEPGFHSRQTRYDRSDLDNVGRQLVNNPASRKSTTQGSMRFKSQMTTNSLANEPAVLFSLTCDNNASELGDTTVNQARIFAENLPAQSRTPERKVEIQSPGKTTIRSVHASILGPDDHESLDSQSLCTISSQNEGDTCGKMSRSRVMERGGRQASGLNNPRENSMDAQAQDDDRRPFCNEGEYSFAPTLSGSTLQVRRLGHGPISNGLATGYNTHRLSQQSDSTQSGGAVTPEGDGKRQHSNRICPLAVEDTEEIQTFGVLDIANIGNTPTETPTSNTFGHAQSRSRHSPTPANFMTTPVLMPRPVSPMKESQLKNTVPQLMKALPPIPGDTRTVASSSLDTVEELTARPLKPARLTPRATLRQFESGVRGETSAEETEEGPARQRTPKLRLRLKNSTTYSSTCTTESRPWNADKNYPWMADSINANLSPTVEVSPSSKYSRPRLKLRVSRSTFDRDDDDGSGTVKRTAGTDRSTSISELALYQPRDLFNWPEVLDTKGQQPINVLEDGHLDQGQRLGSHTHQTPLTNPSTPAASTARDKSTQAATSIDTCVNLVVQVDTSTAATSTGKGTKRSERRRLKKCRSVKSQLANWKQESSRRSGEQTEHTNVDKLLSVRRVSSDSDIPLASGKKTTPSEKSRLKRATRLRRKLSRWMKGAKSLMTAYSKKRQTTV